LPKDEKFYGTARLVTDPYGGFIDNPIVSDVQDERLRGQLNKHGLTLRDAEHITQAVCNHCDIFMTRDEETIINPHGTWIEAQFPPLRVCLPSKALLEVRAFYPYWQMYYDSVIRTCRSPAVKTALHCLTSLKLPSVALYVVETTFSSRFESYLRSHSFSGLPLRALCLRSV
jgi:hypothetical protein